MVIWAIIDALTQGFKDAAKSAAHATFMAELSKTAAYAQPTPFHRLLKALLSGGILGRVYTQNVDDLELKAGLTVVGEEPNCIQLHGSVMKVQCTQCSFTEHMHHHFSTLRLGELPACPECKCWIERRESEGKRIASKGGLLRPAIVLYGESHPAADKIAAAQSLDTSRVDNLLVVGTSLKTFGSFHLIKEMSAELRKRGCGKVYYMDLEEPPTSQSKAFDHVLQADCQDFADYMFGQVGAPEDICFMDGFQNSDLAGWVEAGRVREDMRPSWDWVSFK